MGPWCLKILKWKNIFSGIRLQWPFHVDPNKIYVDPYIWVHLNDFFLWNHCTNGSKISYATLPDCGVQSENNKKMFSWISDVLNCVFMHAVSIFLPFGYAYGCGHNTDFRVYKGPDMVRPNTPLSYDPACNCSDMINKFTLQRTCYDSLTPPISRKIIMLQFSTDLNVYCNIALTLAVTTSTKWDNSGIIIKQLDFHSWSYSRPGRSIY